MGCPSGLSSLKQQSRHLSLSLCVSSFFLLHIMPFHSPLPLCLSPLFSLHQAYTLTNACSHTEAVTHTQSDKLWVLSSYDLNLIAEFIGQLLRRSNLILPGGIQSQLFVWLLADFQHPYTLLSFPAVHPHLCPPICFPNISTYHPESHTHLQMV